MQNFLKVTVDNTEFNLTKSDTIQFSDTTVIKYPNQGSFSSQQWIIKCNEKNNGKIHNFIKIIKNNIPTPGTGATSLPPLGDSFMFAESSSMNDGQNVFVSFERIDIIQNSNISFYYNRYSANKELKVRNSTSIKY